jgi:hypothetical protein
MDRLTRLLELTADEIETSGKPHGDFLVVADVDPRQVDEDDDAWELFDNWPYLEKSTLAIDDVVVCSKEPRGGMLTYSYTLAGVTLPSGRRLYLEYGDVELNAVGLARSGAPDTADEHFIKLHGTGPVDIPYSIFPGGMLFAIDILWSKAAPRSFILDALTEWEADWMEQSLLDEAAEEINTLEQVLEETAAEHEIDDEQLEQQLERLQAAPPWFLTLTDQQLDRVATLPLPEPDHDPPLDHQFTPWRRPTADMFNDLDDPANIQHIAAAWIIGSFN